MADRRISVHIGTSVDASGAVAAKRAVGEVASAVTRLGSVLGGANTILGQFFGSLAKGSIWSAGASLIGYAYRKISEHISAAAEAEKEAAKKSREANDERLKALADYSSALERLARTREASVSQGLKGLNDEIDATKDLTRATLELQRAEARKRGDEGAAAAAEQQMDALDFAAARAKLENEIAAVGQRRENEAAASAEREKGLEGLAAAIRDLTGAQALAVKSAREKAAAGAMEIAGGSSSIAGGLAYVPASEETKKRLADEAEEKLRGTDDFKAVAAQIKDAEARAEELREKEAASRERMKALDQQEENLLRRREAVDLRERAKAADAEADMAKQAADERQKAAARAAEEARRAEVAAAQEAAKERERLDRELHQKRMADLREEIAEQQKAAAPLRAAAAAAQGEFERAFGMYRDPSRAAAEIAEEKSRAEDLDRLHADARRYGGSWRIDELSRLMAAGDAQGQADALASWRKSSRFTPEVEAMVRASAAEKTKTTAEDELRKIEANTADLAAKLDELLQVKG